MFPEFYWKTVGEIYQAAENKLNEAQSELKQVHVELLQLQKSLRDKKPRSADASDTRQMRFEDLQVRYNELSEIVSKCKVIKERTENYDDQDHKVELSLNDVIFLGFTSGKQEQLKKEKKAGDKKSKS